MRTLYLFSCVFLLAKAASAANPSPTGSHFRPDSPSRSISFEANRGQADAAVEFVAHGQNGDLVLRDAEAWLTFPNRVGDRQSSRLQLKLAGAATGVKPEGFDPLAGKANYILGNDPSRWRTDVPTYARVKYRGVYPGVDLIYHGDQQKLEYDFIVQPGVSPSTIVLEFSGADNISLEANGDLQLRVGENSVRQHKPVVYQETAGTRKFVSGSYALHSGGQAGFELGDYDPTQPLIIDPVLAYSTVFGGSASSQGLGVTVDRQENVYVTGITTSDDFPTDAPFQTNKLGSHAAFIVKFNTNGAVVYSTYLGGGALNDQTTTATSGQGIAVDANGDAFVTGYTTATNFPVKNALQPAKAALSYSGRNAFVTELNPAGNGLVYSTYLGGSNTDTATGIALDPDGNAIITGFTASTNFPTFHAAQPVYGGSGDGFVAKLSADGSALVYATFLGGSSYENEDLSTAGGGVPVGAVAVDFYGNAYVTGLTYSTNFPVLNALQPTNATAYYPNYSAAFVTKFDPAGTLVYSTYFGGQFGDIGRAIGVDFQGDAYFAGNSFFGDLPVTNAFQSAYGGRGSTQIGDGFVAALDVTGTNLIYCTYLGGSGDDQVSGLAVRPDDGTVAVTGFTDSPNFPLLSAIQPAGNQGLFKSGDGASTWSLSNSGLASAVIYSIQVDPSNSSIIYALTASGCFKSTDGGANWAPANNGMGTILTPGSGAPGSLLALDPLHPATLYAGAYAGVYKTTNGAANWTLTGTGMPGFLWIQALALDPNAPTTLYAGTYSGGVFKSTDGGGSWSAATNGLTNLNIQALVVDPNNSSNVFAGGGGFTFGSALYRSTNGGGNWTLLGGGLRNGAVNLLVASGNRVYSVIGNSLSYPPGSTPALQISANGGLNWSSLLTAGGLSFTALAMAPPTKPALTIASSSNSDSVSWPASFPGYVLQSTPWLQPANWQNVSQPLVTNNGSYVTVIPMTSTQGYYRLLLTNNSSALPATLYLGTDQPSGQGVLKSTDGGVIWNITGPAGVTVNALAVNPVNPATIYAGLNGGRDGFVAALSPAGQLYSSTYSGGSGMDQGNAIAHDLATDVYVVGSTASADFPVAAPAKVSIHRLASKANDLQPKGGTTSGSDGTTSTPKSTMQHIQDPDPCPDSQYFHITAYTNSSITRHDWPVWSGRSTVTLRTGDSLPPGLSLTTKPTGYVSLGGKITTIGTYTFTLVFTTVRNDGGLCLWSINFIVTVQ